MPRPSQHDDCRNRTPGRWMTLYVRDPGSRSRSFIRAGQVCTSCRKVELDATFEITDGTISVSPY